MWKYKNQIVIRWVSFITAFFLIASLLFVFANEFPEGLGKPQLKELATRLAVSFEFVPWYFWFLLFAVFAILMLVGVPSILMFCTLYVVLNFEVALLAVFAGQFLASLLTIHLSRRQSSAKKLPVYLKKVLATSEISASRLTFWGRLYPAYPMRTIDLVTASLMEEDNKLSSLYPSIAAGILLRCLLPFIWATTLIVIVRNYSPTPVKDASSMLTWSSLLLVQIILPKIPELMICPKPLIAVLAQIESWNKPLTGPSASKRPRGKIKLGMQPRPN